MTRRNRIQRDSLRVVPRPVASLPRFPSVTRLRDSMRRAIPRMAYAVLAGAIALVLAGCSKPRPVATTFSWVFGGGEPRFDPEGPPDYRRWALERMLTRGLVAEDSSGRVVAAAA